MKKVLSWILTIALILSVVPTGIFTTVSAATNSTKIVGDLDCDGEITDWDGVLLARHLAGWAVTVADEKILDIDGDGEITDWDGVMFDRHLAGWSVETQAGKSLTYSITYANTMGAANTNPTSYENSGAEIQLSSISAEHYTFAGWYIGETKVTHIPTDGEGDLAITARWTPVEYTISYANTKGAINNNPAKYHIESDNIVLQSLVREGYRFDGWYLGNEKVTDIPTGSTGNITLTATWTACDYMITYKNTKDATNNNPNGFTTDSAAITLTDLEKEGYTFDGWYNGNTKVTTIPSGTVGNITLTAQWTPISYTATFTADGSIVATRYFTIEDSVISNIPNVPSKAGYTGAWSNYSLGTSNVVIPAVYTLNEYTITYANTKGSENSNPNNYTVITSTFRLSDLQCDGYDFIGWYKGNTKITSIDKGTTGNITLTAKWSPVDYVITYTDTKGTTNTNPVEYDVETGTIYLTGLVAEHYTFDGWYWNGKKVTSIPAGNIGDIELIARWTPVSYNLTYQDTKGATNTNPASYTVEDMIILQDIRADGYTFDGWYIGDEKVATIPVGSSGNKTLTAKWSVNTYSITYQDSKNLEHNGPDTYTVESNTILLPTLSAPGYIFDGWYNGNTKVTSIKAGSTGDLVLTAKWSIITYTITYQDAKDQTHNNPTKYTVESNVTIADLNVTPYRLGYTFEGWYNGEEKITEIKAGSHGNLVLTAKWTPYVYTIIYFNMEGAENPNTLPATTTIETWQGDYELLTPSRDGYNFVRWEIVDRTVANGRIPITTLTWARIKMYALHTDGSVALNANWTPLEYSIKYTTSEKYAGILVYANSNPTTYTSGSTITLQAPAAVNGYTFEGWYEDAAYTKPITLIDKDRWGDLTLYAKYTFTGTKIYDEDDFAEIVYDPSGSYMLANDIAIDDTICNSPTPFTGIFNGNGYTVTGPKVYDYSSREYKATAKTMFGENTGLIVNTIVCGGIANNNTGTIIRCGNLWGHTKLGHLDYAGGIVGENSGTIRECYSTASITGSSYNNIGGIAGKNTGTIQDCYYSGRLTLDDAYGCAGGITANNSGSIIGCYVKGTIDAYYSGTFGSITGKGSSNASISNCFAWMWKYNGAKSVPLCMDGSINCGCKNCYAYSESDSTPGVVRVDYANFKSKTFMTETMGWSEDVWYFVNGSLPKLKWE